MVLRRNQSFVSLFDIRLKSTDRDVVVLRGSPDDAASALLSGTVVIAAIDPMSIKRVTLKAEGAMRLRWTDHINTPRGEATRPVKFEKVIYDQEWTNLEQQQSTLPRMGSRTNLASLSSSTTNLAALSSGAADAASNSSASSINTGSTSNSNGGLHRSSSSHSLAQGNHELPFSMVIPGDIAESVEGLDGAQVVYKLTATVERGRFSNNLFAKKHFRIVRTIGADSFEMSQTMSIDNVWPNKVEYNIETPSKAFAIGSHIPVKMLMVPLLKGLKLGNIRIQLIQQNTLTSPYGPQHNKEKVVHEQITQAPEDGYEGRDHWDITESMEIPPSLSKVTQDVEIGNYIKVYHKLKFAVGLVNPDGHVSELRASLPVILFISPNVTIQSFDPTQVVVPGREPDQETLFDRTQASTDGQQPQPSSSDPLNDCAPPNYDEHVYDRLWNDIPQSQFNSPNHSEDTSPYRSRRGSFNNNEALAMTTASGANTTTSPPSTNGNTNNNNNSSTEPSSFGLAAMDPNQRSQLAAGLRALERQQHSSSANSSRSASGANTPFQVGSYSSTSGDYFQTMQNQQSPRLSAQGGDDDLSRVPSYDTAIKSDGAASDVEDLAPGYNDSGASSPQRGGGAPGRFMNQHLSNVHQHQRVNSLSAPGSSVNLSGLSGLASMTPMTPNTETLGDNNNNSTASLRSSHQRNQSSSTLSSLLHRNSSSRSLFGLKKNH